jgi:hypothetical protein
MVNGRQPVIGKYLPIKPVNSGKPLKCKGIKYFSMGDSGHAAGSSKAGLVQSKKSQPQKSPLRGGPCRFRISEVWRQAGKGRQ